MTFFDLPNLSKKTISYIFILKVCFGILLWFIYTFYYNDRANSDIFKFFDDARYIYKALPEHPLHFLQMVIGINTDADYLKPYYSEMVNWYKPWKAAKFHDNKIIIQFNALAYFFSFGYYNVHTVFMCFLSLIGLTGIYKTTSSLIKDKHTELVFAIFLIPSVLFWASGVLKEGIIIFSLGLTIYSIYKLLFLDCNKLYFLFLFIFSTLLLYQTKMYIFAALLPSIISLVITRFSSNKNVFLKFAVVHLLLFTLAVNLYRLHIGWNTLLFLHQKQMGFIQTAIVDHAKSYISINYLEPNVGSLIKNTPSAIVNTLFRPHLFESKSLFILVSAVENFLFLIFLFVSILFFKKPDKKNLPLLYTCLFFVFTLALLIGLITPVLGSIVRYRIPILPFYTIILLLIWDKEKTVKRLSHFYFLISKKQSKQ